MNLSVQSIQQNPKVNFCGKQDVLYSLGKAFNESQKVARDNFVNIPTDIHLAKAEAYIDAATQDKTFMNFIKDKSSLKTLTDSFETLPEIKSNTMLSHRMTSKEIKEKGVRLFAHELIQSAKNKGLIQEDAKRQMVSNFLHEILQTLSQ